MNEQEPALPPPGKPSQPMAPAQRLPEPRLDLQSEWALAVVLHTMSNAALMGLSVRRTQTVVDHLRMAADNQSISMELRATCARLSGFWQTIDLQ